MVQDEAARGVCRHENGGLQWTRHAHGEGRVVQHDELHAVADIHGRRVRSHAIQGRVHGSLQRVDATLDLAGHVVAHGSRVREVPRMSAAIFAIEEGLDVFAGGSTRKSQGRRG